MEKVFYILPGFTEDEHSRLAYKEISNILSEKGIENKIIKITWKHKVMSDYVNEALSQIDMSKEIYLIGFSYGAFISFIISTKINIKMQILLSLSPYFKEDLDNLKGWWKKYVGKKRIEDFNKISFNELAIVKDTEN